MRADCNMTVSVSLSCVDTNVWMLLNAMDFFVKDCDFMNVLKCLSPLTVNKRMNVSFKS